MNNILYFKSVLIQEGKNRFYRAIYVISDVLPYTIEVTQDNEGWFYERMGGFYIRSAEPIPTDELLNEDTTWEHF